MIGRFSGHTIAYPSDGGGVHGESILSHQSINQWEQNDGIRRSTTLDF